MDRRAGDWQRAVVAVAGSTLLAVACSGGAGSVAATPSPTLTPTPAITATPPTAPTTPAITPSVAPTEPESAREAELEELRATDRFLELAEADRAKNATWARFGYHQFAPHADGEVLFEWANKEELWNSIAPKIRDECLLAGPEATRPMWDAQVVIPASINPRWNNDSTAGRGDFVEFSCRHMGENGQPAERWWGVLIYSADASSGAISAVSDSFPVGEDDYVDFAASREGIRLKMWDWIESQPSGDSGVER